MFSSSDRSIKASVPWYSNWKDTFMELKESSLYTGISCDGSLFPDCSHGAPYLLPTDLFSTTFFVFLPVNASLIFL